MSYPVLVLTDGIDSFDFAGDTGARTCPSLAFDVWMFADARHGEVPRPKLEWELVE